MPEGVEIRGKSVRVNFRWNGKQYRETIGKNTPDNMNHAARLAKIIRLEIDSGTFEYARHFPESPHVKTNTFGHYAALLLEIKKTELAYSSFRGLESKMRCHILPKWGSAQAKEIDYFAIQKWIQAELAKLSSKTIKEVISITGMVFQLYSAHSGGQHNPVNGIRVRLPDDEDPDPFTLDEIKAILETPTDRVQEINMMQFMIWDGPRLSEAMALCWEDVLNLEEGIIRYRRAMVRGRYKVTKTRRSSRTQKLLKPAREALQKQWRITGQSAPLELSVIDRDNRTERKSKLRPVFLNSNTFKPHYSDLSIRDRFWRVHLKNAGVRYRGPSNCRHTFISQMLSSGAVPLQWIAAHVGHTTTHMIQRKYGTWIRQDGPDIHSILEAHFKL